MPGLENLRRENFEVLLNRLEGLRALRGARLLEVGSAWGWFLDASRRRGARTLGIEPDAATTEIARRKGLEVEVGFFPNDLRDRGPFDFIVFNDVFEHLPHPADAVAEVKRLLCQDGIAVFNCPSSSGILFRIAGLLARIGVVGPWERMWQAGMPSPHLSYFNPGNLCLLARRHGELEPVGHFPLRSVSRRGLGARIGASHSGIQGAVLFLAVWALSFVLPLLPSDIEVSVFRKCQPTPANT